MMKDTKVRFQLWLYRSLGQCLTPFFWLILAFRAWRGKEDWARRKERFGKASISRPEGKVLWLHAASVGETAALVPLIHELKKQSLHILLTTGTLTAAAFAKNRFGDAVIHQYAPLDTKRALERFFNHWDIGMVLVCESEIWPLRILFLHERNIPQILVNAHLSEKSYNKWYKHLRLARFVFSKFDLVLAQTQQDAHYYYALGAPTVEVIGNLKAEVLPELDLEFIEECRSLTQERLLWGALSTHEPEEMVAAEVHKALKPYIPNLLTLIVPRHPERSAALIERFQEAGLKVVCRTSQTLPDAETDIWLGDTIGEMCTYISLIEIAFMGKSLGIPLEKSGKAGSNKGGHNPIEPALIGAAIVTGPYTENFSEIYKELQEKGALCQVADPTQLAYCLHTLFNDSTQRARMVSEAQKVVQGHMGALKSTLTALDPFLQALLMERALSQTTGDLRAF